MIEAGVWRAQVLEYRTWETDHAPEEVAFYTVGGRVIAEKAKCYYTIGFTDNEIFLHFGRNDADLSVLRLHREDLDAVLIYGRHRLQSGTALYIITQPGTEP